MHHIIQRYRRKSRKHPANMMSLDTHRVFIRSHSQIGPQNIRFVIKMVQCGSHSLRCKGERYVSIMSLPIFSHLAYCWGDNIPSCHDSSLEPPQQSSGRECMFFLRYEKIAVPGLPVPLAWFNDCMANLEYFRPRYEHRLPAESLI